MHRLTAPVTLALLAVGAAGLAGCRADQRVAVGGPAATVSTTAAPQPPAAAAPAPPSTSTSTSRRSVATTTTAARPTTTKVAPPKLAATPQGARVVAVFVATGPSLASPSFATAKTRLATLGYRGFSGGDTACSRGAKEALPQLQPYSLSLPFATQADAARFTSLYGRVVGTATVTIFCAD